jgi:hypothetical protein
MHETKADPDRNRLYVTLKGRMTGKDAKQASARVISDLKKLKPGFDVITDISEFEPVTQKETELLVQAHKLFIKKGVGRVTRVIGSELKAVVANIQFERVSRKSNIVAKCFDSVGDAECYLDGCPSQSQEPF